MDFYVWLLRSSQRTILVDTGFTAATAAARKRVLDCYRCPIDTLARLGVDAATVTDVVLTHLHFDHAGNLAKGFNQQCLLPVGQAAGQRPGLF
ncbi:MAG: MBL fold metallo-hydrolase [Gammaproteobacteria bacterium]|nr:MBL fold metallo-hydrolase [Gammaproteobacteria bacterium]MBU1443847.1 MBL fold metallo-hydrolase [Gammaproteobacteria bacterium]